MSNLSKHRVKARITAALLAALMVTFGVSIRAQTVQERGPQSLSADAIQAAIDALGSRMPEWEKTQRFRR